MAASTPEELQRTARRRRLAKGLLIGAAAIGVPALANAWVRRRAGRLQAPTWGRPRFYAWKHGEVAFQQLGKGPPLLLLHSFGPGHDSTEWQRAAEILADEHRVFAVDLLGWGRSEKPPITYDGEIYIQLVRDFLEDVVREPALLGAAGLSAAYAIQLGVDRPDLVRSLAVVSPLGLDLHGEEPDLKDALLHRFLRLPILGTSALNVYTSRSGITNHLRNEVYAAPERVDAALVEHHYRASHEPGASASLAAYLAGYLNHSVKAVLPRLGQPVFIAWGRQAKSPAVDRSDQWLKHLPQAHLEVFKGAGTLPHAETPVAFCRQLSAFFTDQASAEA
ncbi:MAG: alpha/beta fold hydrolase [Acidobacteria bacterium]|nr:alpha/beta fold hydrolase [Acidobacteriota bacterium]